LLIPLICYFMLPAFPSVEIAWSCCVLMLTVYLFASELLPLDVAALCVLVLLGLTDVLAPVLGLSQGLLPASALLSGFSSNAVIAIVAVMILCKGLDRTGVMGRVAAWALRVGGSTESRVLAVVCSAVGIVSSFMQNIGATALFMPVLKRISDRTQIPLSRLMMPMGFCAMLGGTVTLVGSSPLIMLNDLMSAANAYLPQQQQLEAWSLFSVAPVGIALLIAGVLYLLTAGRSLLPAYDDAMPKSSDTLRYFHETYGLHSGVSEVFVPADSSLVGQTLQKVEHPNSVRVIAAQFSNGSLRIGAGDLKRSVGIEANTVLGIIGSEAAVVAFVQRYGLEKQDKLQALADHLVPAKAGIGELVIPPGSAFLGKSARELKMRSQYGFSLLALHRAGKTVVAGQGVRDTAFQAGDTLVGHTAWEALARLESNRNVVVLNQDYPHEQYRPHKLGWALGFFTLAMVLLLATDISLALALLTGAMGMVLSGVLSMDEAYEAVSWRAVFLLASLIPLGVTVQLTGTAEWLAQGVLALLQGAPPVALLAAVTLLTTLFTLFLSNVGATVLMVPLAINIALAAGADPAVFALAVGLAASNSFLIPTHQVNALIMGPGGYRTADFARVGGGMTVVFLVVMLMVLTYCY
jgi:di/tricarboxylate transporter